MRRQVDIREARSQDAEAVVEIYNFYVLNSHATFEIDPIAANEMAVRIDISLSRGLPFLIAAACDSINR